MVYRLTTHATTEFLGGKVSFNWFNEPVQPVNGNLLTTLKHAYAIWSVEFDIIALGPQGPEHSSIFHVTTGENAAGMGTRYPSIFITQSYQKLQFQNDIDRTANQGYVHPEELSESAWTSVKVYQHNKDTAMLLTIEINGVTVYEVENKQPRTYDNMLVYSSDPWYPQRANVKMRNLRYSTSACNFRFTIF